jgi:hypothetical protein
MPDDTEAAALCTRLEAIIKEAEDAEARAAAARHRVPSSPSSASSPTAAPPLVSAASSTYEDTVVAELHLQAAAVLNVR